MDLKELQYAFLQTSGRMGRLDTSSLFSSATRQEYLILEVLHLDPLASSEQQGIRISDMAAIMQVSPPAVSRMVQNMESRGLVRKVKSPENSRNTFIQITEQGEQVRLETDKKISRLFTAVIDRCGKDRAEKLVSYFLEMLDVAYDELQRQSSDADHKGENK